MPQQIQVVRPKFLQDHREVCATGKGAIGTQAETQLLHAGGKSEVMNFLSYKKMILSLSRWWMLVDVDHRDCEHLAADKQKEIT